MAINLTTGTLRALQARGTLSTAGQEELRRRTAASTPSLALARFEPSQPAIQPPAPAPVVAAGLKDAIIGAIGGFVAGGPGGAVAGGIAGLTKPSGGGPIPGNTGGGTPVLPGNFSGCGRGQIRVGNTCVSPADALPGGDPFTSPVQGTAGPAVMGRFGAGLSPDVHGTTRRSCLPGMVLGRDGICYNSRDIRNKDRMWPKARKPLLTGGDLNAISTAARAAKRIETKTKQLQKMGMMKKPAPRRRAHHHHG